MFKRNFKPGAHVQFFNPSECDRWFVRKNAGVVIESRHYGPVEPMVTVDFGNVRVHVPGGSLRIIDGV